MKKFILIAVTALIFTLVCNAQTTPVLQEGNASWYGTEFDGQPTASGEIFTSSGYTAAHPSLPFGTLLTITNKNNNKKVTVRVNDRGPFIANRVIDLSEAAAKYLEITTSGTAPVSITIAEAGAALGPVVTQPPSTPAVTATPPPPATQPPASTPAVTAAPPPPVPSASSDPAPPAVTAAPPPPTPPASLDPAPPAAPPPSTPAVTTPSAPAVQPAKAAVIKPAIPPVGTNKRYRLQVGAFKTPKNAVSAFDKLKSIGLNPSYERSGDWYRVVLSGIKADDVQSIAEKIWQAGFPEALIREEP